MPRIGFSYSTMDRVDLTRRSIKSLQGSSLTGKEFDLIWVDGSKTAEGRELPRAIAIPAGKLVEVHQDVGGGADRTICYELKRLLDLGYDYCGLIENDIELEPGWLDKLLELFEIGERDGLRVGAVSARTFESRILAYRRGYAIFYNMGAGMVLFKREAARIVLESYWPRHAGTIKRYFLSKFGFNIGKNWETFMGCRNPLRVPDHSYAMELCREGFVCLGLIPSMASNIDTDAEQLLHTSYVRSQIEPTAEDERIAALARGLTVENGIRQKLRCIIRRRLAFIRTPLLNAFLWLAYSAKKQIKRKLERHALGRSVLKAAAWKNAMRERIKQKMEHQALGRIILRAYRKYKAAGAGCGEDPR